MIRHFTGALGRLARAPVSTGANILTLTLGLAAIILAWGIVAWWESSDASFANANRIRVATSDMERPGLRMGVSIATTFSLGRQLREDAPELEAVARLQPQGEVMATLGEKNVMLHGASVEADFLRIFDLKFLAGDPVTALQSADSMILGQEAAEKLFGSAKAALGQHILLNKQRDVIVTGVIAPIPEPTHLLDADNGGTLYDYFSSWPAAIDRGPQSWLARQGFTYMLMPADGRFTADMLNQRLKRIAETRVPPSDSAIATVRFASIPLREIVTRKLDSELFGSLSGRFTVTMVLLGLGVMVLMAACLNYANLATAQAVSRYKQVGMRKVLGAGRGEIIAQTFVEAALQTLIALALALALCWLATPIIRAQTGADVAASLFRNPVFLPVLTLLALGVAIVAGLYPAIAMAHIRPTDALRAGKSRGGPRFVSQTLVGLQFATASFLLIAVLVLGQQNAFLREAGGKGRDAVVVLGQGSQTGVTVAQLKQTLGGRPDLMQISATTRRPWSPITTLLQLARSPDAAASELTAMSNGAGFGYFDVLGYRMLAGRAFDEGRDSPAATLRNTLGRPLPIVLDRTMSGALGFPSPQAAIGQLIHVGASQVKMMGAQPTIEIIGVVEDQPQHFLGPGTTGNVYTLVEGPFTLPIIRLVHGREDEAIAALRNVWTSLTPRPFAPAYVSDLFETGFRRFDQTGKLFQGLSLLAFLISATGLFGMAVQVIQRRRHEIGVRKTLGSTALRVVVLLIRDFSRPVVVANLLAWPIAYLAAQAYLSSFMKRVDLTFIPFLVSFFITLGIAWLVVGAQTVRAANLRPADVLRHA